MRRLAFALPLVFVASAAAGAGWAKFTEPNSPAVSAGIEEQDHGGMLVMCGEAHKLPLTVIYHEPHANWQKGQSVDVILGLDDGPNLPPWHADALLSRLMGEGGPFLPSAAACQGAGTIGERWYFSVS
jgi:hypothetical protein